MQSFYRKYYKTIFDIALIGITIYLFMLLFSYLYKIATPIFFALAIYVIIEPLAKFLHRKGVKKSIASTISTLVFILVILAILTGLGAIFTSQIYNLVEKIPVYQRILQEQIVNNVDFWQKKLSNVSPEWIERAKEFSSTIIERGGKLATGFLNALFTGLTSVSTFLVNFLIGIILAYFLSIESENWKRLAQTHTPKTFKKAFQFIKENVLLGIGGYLKAQLKMISVTFIVIFAALLVLGVKNAFSISLLMAIFDLLPLLGVSTVFIPWIIYLFIVGQTTMAIWLTVLFATVIIVRQLLEPKITGDTLGVSAFTMLSFMIISLSLFGVAGLILSPILIITLKALYEQGYLKSWIRLPEEEYE